MKKLSKLTLFLLIGLGLVFFALIFQSAFLWVSGICISAFFGIIFIIRRSKGFMTKILGRSGQKYYPSFWLIVIFGYIFTVAAAVLVIGFINEWDFTFGGVLTIIIVNLFLGIFYTYLYFLPYLIANKRKHLQTHAIYVLNIFAGWTILAWIIALIWAYTEPRENVLIKQEVALSGAEELKKYKELLDQGIITQEEFDAKKKQLLGI